MLYGFFFESKGESNMILGIIGLLIFIYGLYSCVRMIAAWKYMIQHKFDLESAASNETTDKGTTSKSKLQPPSKPETKTSPLAARERNQERAHLRAKKEESVVLPADTDGKRADRLRLKEADLKKFDQTDISKYLPKKDSSPDMV